jgi:RNA polymerase sigma-70 factor (ECF subfamily)
MTSENDISDGELVRRARAGDPRAHSTLVGRYMRPAYLVALSVTRHHENAEDAAQEAFVVAMQRLDECRNPERFGGWLMTIVKNRSRNLLRRENLRQTSDVPETVEGDDPTPDRESDRRELRGLLREAMDALSEVQREVVLLHDLEGWKHREIADRLEIPSGTVRSHLHFARKKLRGALEGIFDDYAKR